MHAAITSRYVKHCSWLGHKPFTCGQHTGACVLCTVELPGNSVPECSWALLLLLLLLCTQLREGRQLRSKTVDNNNNPEYDQLFRMLVDDPKTQVLPA